jgi:DNA oxidative demethylase
MSLNLFADVEQRQMWREELCPAAVVLRGFAGPDAAAICAALHGITTQAPFRHMITPGGFRKAA